MAAAQSPGENTVWFPPNPARKCSIRPMFQSCLSHLDPDTPGVCRQCDKRHRLGLDSQGFTGSQEGVPED